MKLVRLNISVSEDLRREMKVAAAKLDSTMSEFVARFMKMAVETVKENDNEIDVLRRKINAGVKDPEQDTNSAV